MEPALHPAHVDQLDSVEGEGIGLAGRRPERKSLVRRLLGGYQVTLERPSPCSVIRERPVEEWLPDPLDLRCVRSSSASLIVARSPASSAVEHSKAVGKETCGRVGELVDDAAGLRGPSPAELEGSGRSDGLVACLDGVDQCGPVACSPGHVDRMGGQCQSPVQIRVVRALRAQQCEQAGPVGAVGVSEAGERRRHHLDAFVVDPTDGADKSAAVSQRGPHQEVDGVDVVGQGRRSEQGLAMRGITSQPLGVSEPEQQCRTAVQVVGRSPVEQVERIPIPAQCLVGGQHGQGSVPGQLGIDHRLFGVTGLGGMGPVVGELAYPFAGVLPVELSKRVRHPLVRPGPPAR